eukprot:c15048_g3_i1 orf=355-1251(+)
MLPHNHTKSSSRKSLWQITRRWIQQRSKEGKPEKVPPLNALNLPDYDAGEGDYSAGTQKLRLFVGTWNVAGKTPTDEWVMQEWLGSQEPADIYVIGFQEIVPLNAGNVLGNEDNGVSTRKWDELIMRALNESSSNSLCPYSCWSSDSELANTRTSSSTTTPSSPSSADDSMFHAYYEDIIGGRHASGGALLRKPAYDKYACSKGTDLDGNVRRHSSVEESCCINWDSYSALESTASSSVLFSNIIPNIIPSPAYHQIASKQLVGLFTSVWIRRDLYRHVKAVEVSTVGCGIMGRLGNK